MASVPPRRPTDRSRTARLAATVLAALAAVPLATGCAPEMATHGDLIEDDRLGRLKPGTQNKDDVAQILGSPSSTGVFGDETWYYIADVEERYSVFDRETVERQVVTLRFDQEGVLREMDLHGVDRGREVDLVERETPSFGESPNFLQQIIGNLGRFNKSAQPERR